MTNIIPFADAATFHTVTEAFACERYLDNPVPVVPGQLDYLAGFSVEIDSGELLRLCCDEPAGAPLVNLSGRMLRILDNNIWFQLHPNGTGCIANMSTACRYRLRLDGKCQGRITYYGYSVPGPVSLFGEPQQCVPPYIGTIQLWNDIVHIPVSKGVSGTLVLRVGNHIKELAFVFYDGRDKRFCIDSPSVQCDLSTLENAEIWHSDTGVYRVTFPNTRDRMLPTVVNTVLELAHRSPYHGFVDIMVNDVAVWKGISTMEALLPFKDNEINDKK
jgi:hypothetical protein